MVEFLTISSEFRTHVFVAPASVILALEPLFPWPILAVSRPWKERWCQLQIDDIPKQIPIVHDGAHHQV
jgi:hypothetical protein